MNSPHKLLTTFEAPDDHVFTLYDNWETAIARYPHVSLAAMAARRWHQQVVPHACGSQSNTCSLLVAVPIRHAAQAQLHRTCAAAGICSSVHHAAMMASQAQHSPMKLVVTCCSVHPAATSACTMLTQPDDARLSAGLL